MHDGTPLPPAPFYVRPAIVARLDAGDRALFIRCVLPEGGSRVTRLCWTALTHVGGATMSILAALLPLVAGWPRAVEASRLAVASLVVSHLVVQVIKRSVGRPRPSRGTTCAALAAEPDRFSFPSGHSAAAMSVAFVYASAFPSAAPPLLAMAGLVGMSRVFLGVHYPGDVLAGQAIAVATCMALG